MITIFSSVDPETSDINNTVESCYIDKVRTVHSQGAFGSRGYQSPWLIEEAEKNLLRTHTTAVSARMLHALSKKVGTLVLFKGARVALMGWESHSSSIIKTSFKTKKKGIAMNVILCYITINDNNDVNKDQFYERPQSIIPKCPGKDLIFLMGDIIDKVGMDNTGYEDTMR
ncbi:unnamed protein product [Schistosoma margrebowiei]|uniref:Uncharacterized protein n=1 Tax=Schistosoma margrebowiei TaxID=48269 RepID=A0A183N9D9_9TREM|nr:unnamed protein product [Schistosoma margrebowiei]